LRGRPSVIEESSNEFSEFSGFVLCCVLILLFPPSQFRRSFAENRIEIEFWWFSGFRQFFLRKNLQKLFAKNMVQPVCSFVSTLSPADLAIQQLLRGALGGTREAVEKPNLLVLKCENH
jgi:hypothetical protein